MNRAVEVFKEEGYSKDDGSRGNSYNWSDFPVD